MSMAGKQILTDEKTIVNIFRNMPAAVHARHLVQLPDRGAQCLNGDIAFNDAFCQMTGYTPREIEALFENCLDRMVLEADRAQLMQEIHALCAYPHEGTVSFRVTVKDGRRMRVEERMRSIRQADGSVWLYAVVMDAREDKQQMPVPQEQKRVTVQTFGYLNILIDGEPMVFEHEKAKELLAVLIDRQGKFVSSGEIISCLWEDEAVNENTQSRCRKAAYHLRRILAAYGLDDLLESTPKGYRRIRTEMIDCDLYHYLNGEEAYVNRFRGAYMSDYSWAEQTLTMLVYGK